MKQCLSRYTRRINDASFLLQNYPLNYAQFFKPVISGAEMRRGGFNRSNATHAMTFADRHRMKHFRCQRVLVHNASAGCDDCQSMWGLPTSGGDYFILTNKNVTVPIEGGLFPPGMGGEVVVAVIDVAKFRAEGGSIKIKGLKGSKTDDLVRAFVKAYGKSGDVAGHVIANDFGGPAYIGPLGNNIFPENSTVNNSAWKTNGENVFKTLVGQNNIVCAMLVFTYGDTTYPARPDYITWQFLYQKTSADKWQLKTEPAVHND